MLENPFIKNLKSFYLYSLVWLLITASYFILIHLGIQVPLFIAILDSLIFNSILAVFGLGLWYPAKSINYEKGTPARFIFTHLTGGIIFVAIWIYTGHFITNVLVNDQEKYKDFFNSSLVWRILIGLLFYFLIILFYYLIIYYQEYKNKITREAELKSLITEAELKSLKFQINPHFIFNSLNSISSLTIDDPAKARSMILKLADFLRYTVTNNARMMNSLDEELKNVTRYLEIEKIRFEDKFDYEQSVNEECLHAPVPNMILQPLFENAIKHAVYESLGKINILMKCHSANGFLNIEVTNTFEKDSVKKGSGVGLKNISDRLFLIYNRRDLFKVSSEENIFRVQLFIPVSGKM